MAPDHGRRLGVRERVPFPKPPRELAERYFTLSGWREYDRGGHFPAVAEPWLLAEVLRDTFRPCAGSADDPDQS